MTTCPICGSVAIAMPGPRLKTLALRCSVDGYFDIEADCLAGFGGLDLAVRHHVLNRAIKSASPDARPCISQALIVQDLKSQCQAMRG